MVVSIRHLKTARKRVAGDAGHSAATKQQFRAAFDFSVPTARVHCYNGMIGGLRSPEPEWPAGRTAKSGRNRIVDGQSYVHPAASRGQLLCEKQAVIQSTSGRDIAMFGVPEEVMPGVKPYQTRRIRRGGMPNLVDAQRARCVEADRTQRLWKPSIWRRWIRACSGADDGFLGIACRACASTSKRWMGCMCNQIWIQGH